MTANKTTKTVERLTAKLEELDSQLDLDTYEAIAQFEDHCHHLREAYHGFPDQLQELKEDLGIEWHEMKAQLDELDIQMALARMETVEAFRKRQEGIIKALNAMENTIRKIELAEDHEGLLQYKDFAKRARKLEDKIGALDLHFTLSANHTGEALDREKEKIKKVVGKVAKELSALEKVTAKELGVIGKGILKASAYVWDFTKIFFEYEETEEERRRKKEIDGEVPD